MLPEPNIFIPTDFSLLPIEKEEKSEHPVIIHDTSLIRVWFKQDDTFLKPKIFVGIDLRFE